MKILKSFIFTIFINMGLLSITHGQIAVIVNQNNPTTDITLSELGKIYSGSQKVWKSGKKIVLVEQKSKKELSDLFFTLILGKKTSKVRGIWVKKMMKGELAPPKSFDSNESVVSYLIQNEGAIGFVEINSVTKDVRVLTIDGKSPDNMNYGLK